MDTARGAVSQAWAVMGRFAVVAGLTFADGPTAARAGERTPKLVMSFPPQGEGEGDAMIDGATARTSACDTALRVAV